ncbi:MAG: hypothetical protein LJE94_10615 [Deltaproteobacteria bacterium]|nr:hypothetical protein [Deltaproteobacteria bacterium]
MFSKRILSFVFVWLAGVVLTGLSAGAFSLNVRFEQVNGLVAKDRVLLDGAHIGDVRTVDYGDTAVFTVGLVIKKEFEEFLTEYSRFAIVPDPRDDDRMAVEVIQTRAGGAPLKAGSSVAGSHKFQVLLEMMQDDTKDGIGFLKNEYRRFSDDIHALSESEKIRKLKDEMARLVEELKMAGKETRERITTEIIPMLEKEVEDLRKELKKSGRDREIEPVEEELDKIKHI